MTKRISTITLGICLFMLPVLQSFRVLSLEKEELIGTWMLVEEEYESKEAQQVVDKAMAEGTYMYILMFNEDGSYVHDFNNGMMLQGNWEVSEDKIVTTNNKKNRPVPPGMIQETSAYEDVTIQGDTLIMKAKSEFIGKSIFVRK